MADQPFTTMAPQLDVALARSNAGQGVETLLKAQEAGLSAFESLTRLWFEQRHDTLAAASSTVAKLCRCKDLGEAAEIQSSWLAGAAARTASDLTALSESALSFSLGNLGVASELFLAAKAATPFMASRTTGPA